jgi:CHAD domain-containing protein
MSKAWNVENLDPDAPLEQNARAILRVRIGEFYSYEPIVSDPLATTDLHNLRIAAKRLRYTLELFADVFGAHGTRQIERIKAIQEALGNVHDLDVRISLISDELVALTKEEIAALNRALASSHPSTHRALTTALLRPPPDAPQSGLYALLSRQHADRQAAYRHFKSLWDQFALEGMRDDLARLSSTRIALL